MELTATKYVPSNYFNILGLRKTTSQYIIMYAYKIILVTCDAR